jgi:hypothetical protein
MAELDEGCTTWKPPEELWNARSHTTIPDPIFGDFRATEPHGVGRNVTIWTKARRR